MVGLVEGRTSESMGDDDGLLTIYTTKLYLDDRNGCHVTLGTKGLTLRDHSVE